MNTDTIAEYLMLAFATLIASEFVALLAVLVWKLAER